jgi:hypothetical protein
MTLIDAEANKWILGVTGIKGFNPLPDDPLASPLSGGPRFDWT